ncbi:MAG: hypothetical protein WBJ51_00930, partial [Methanoculleus sp.]
MSSSYSRRRTEFSCSGESTGVARRGAKGNGTGQGHFPLPVSWISTRPPFPCEADHPHLPAALAASSRPLLGGGQCIMIAPDTV